MSSLYRVLSPDDGTIIAVDAATLDEARKIVETYYVEGLILDIIDTAKERNIIDINQWDEMVCLINMELIRSVLKIYKPIQISTKSQTSSTIATITG
jgi:hypothetical protein